MSMFTLIFNDFLLHVLTLPHIHSHGELLLLQTERQVRRSVPAVTAHRAGYMCCSRVYSPLHETCRL